MDKLLWKCWADLQASRKSKMAEAIKHFAAFSKNGETYEVKLLLQNDSSVIILPIDLSKTCVWVNKLTLEGVYRETPRSNAIILNGSFGSSKLEFPNENSLNVILMGLQNLMSDQSGGSDSPPPTSSESE